jgi:RNA-binding protein
MEKINMDEKELRKKAMMLTPTIRIGKQGLTESIIKEITAQLKKKKMIKIRLLKAVLQEKKKQELIDELAEKTNSRVINKIGFIVTLAKHKI